jgi:hypothetical protein
MQSMGAQYEYQNKFANNQYNRDLGTLAATGEESRKNIGATGAQDRLTSVVQGEQQRLNTETAGTEQRKGIQETGSQQRETDSNRISTEGTEQRSTDTNRINVQGEQDRKGYVTQGEQARETLGYQDQLAASKANRQSARSKSMARSF